MDRGLQKLAIAVIERALRDLSHKNARIKKEAKDFFKSPDFHTWCGYANLAHAKILRWVENNGT